MEQIIVNQFKNSGYNGGKGASGVVHRVINEIRPHEVFISAFLGNCAVLRTKKRTAINIGIDLDVKVVNAWQEMQFDWLQLYHASSLDILEQLCYQYKGKRIVIYCDPPYRMSTRKSKKRIYQHEFSDKDHTKFLNLVLRLSLLPWVDIIISHYPDNFYNQRLTDWRSETFTARTRTTTVKETIFMNFAHTDGLLHQYDFVGDNKDERYNLKYRTIGSLISKLDSMDPRKRMAIIDTIRQRWDVKNNLSP